MRCGCIKCMMEGVCHFVFCRRGYSVKMAQLFVWQFLCCNLVETAGVCETKDASKMFVEKWMNDNN